MTTEEAINDDDATRHPTDSDRLGRPAWNLGDRPDDPQDIDERRSVRRYEPSRDISDLLAAGHGFTIESGADPARPPRRCRICDTAIYHRYERWICEFSADQYVTEPPAVADGRSCRCNWCVVNQNYVPPNRPVEICSALACKREDQRRSRAAERERSYDRDRLAAIEVIRFDPCLTNAQIAERLGVRPVRVKEARELSGVSI